MTITAPMRILAISLLIFVYGCRQNIAHHDPESVAPFRAPSATEAFNLQSKCVELGQKILENNVVGSALTQKQTSHYNPADNRCYVLLNVATADLGALGDRFTSDDFLEDGQTGEILATRYCKGSECTANIMDESLEKMVKNPILPSETEVRDLMDKFVDTDRHPQHENTP